MTLQLLQFVRTASADQITQLALQFIHAYPNQATELLFPNTFALIVTPTDVPTLPTTVYFTEAMLNEAKHEYAAWDLDAPNKVRLVKYLRDTFSFGLKESLDLATRLIERHWQ